jgi:pimeloyl-ACP methyl ester carboxylesterase
MSDLKNRVVWLHVTLPGQEANASELKLSKYPTFEDIADELCCVVDFLKIPQVVCMGDGIGSSISTLFAIRNPNRCYGVILIEPIGSSANIFESIRFKLNNLHLLSRNKTNLKNSSAFNRMISKPNQDIEKDSMELPLNEAPESKLLDTSISNVHNDRNLELLAESFLK